MPRISAAIDRANTILRAHGTPFHLRAGHGSRWLSIYENRPCQKVRERAARGYASRAVETLCDRLLNVARAFPNQGLEELLETGAPETAGCPATSRSITGSGSTQPSAGVHLSSGSTSCSADEPGETQHLGGPASQHGGDCLANRLLSSLLDEQPLTCRVHF